MNQQKTEIKIGVWGPPASGKTTYILALYNILGRIGGWRIQPVSGDSWNLIGYGYRKLFEEGVFPSPTEPSHIPLYRFRIIRDATPSPDEPEPKGQITDRQVPVRREGFLRLGTTFFPQAHVKTVFLEFFDTSGEWFRNPEKMLNIYPDEWNPLEKIADCDGILFLIDPTPFLDPSSDSLKWDIIKTLSLLHKYSLSRNSQERLPHHFSFCLTKIDLDHLWQHHSDPLDLAKRLLGATTIETIRNYCMPGRYRFFAISSVGRVRDPNGNWRPNITMPDEDRARRIFDKDELNPFGIFESLDWLISSIEESQHGKRVIIEALSTHWMHAEDSLGSQPTPSTSSTYQSAIGELLSFLETQLQLRSLADGIKHSSSKHLTIVQMDARHIPQWGLLPASIPFAALRSQAITESDLQQIRQLTGGHMCILISWSEMDTQENRRLLARMQDIYAYVIIPATYRDFQTICASEDSADSFRRFLLQHADLASISPFVVTGPISNRMFFGREHELRGIIEHAFQTNHILVGGRRIGKTSILKQLEHVRLPAANFHTLYHDCSFTPTQAELVQAVIADKHWFPEPPAIKPGSFAEVIYALPDDKPLIILLDEVDKLIRPDRQAGFPLLNTLRAMASADRCHFVLSGEQVLRSEVLNPNSPIYNFGDTMLIGRLDFRSVEELVTRPMKELEIELTDESEMTQRIWGFTSGHPNIVQRLCQRLIMLVNQRGSRHLAPEDVEHVVANPDFFRKDFLDVYWERATALERLCSLIMAAKDSVRTLITVQKALLNLDIDVTLHQVDDALERLVDLRNILTRTPEGYEFSVMAFPEIIAKTARLNDWIALNCETYRRFGDVEPRPERGVL